MEELPRYKDCFICGCENKAGADVLFVKTEKGVKAKYPAPKKHNSYQGIIHGGVIAALLDECIGWAVCVEEKTMCVTAELNIRYKKAIPVDTDVTVSGFAYSQPEEKKRYGSGYGHIADQSGEIYASAEGKYFAVPDETVSEVLDMMAFDNNPGKKVLPEDIWGQR
jgi:uncharacterized protein (TIGR00369 family)